MDRRREARTPLNCFVRMAVAVEQPVPSADAIDGSDGALLVALAEPFGFVRGARVCLSMPTSAGQLHMVGRVQRVERGDDFRTYVAVAVADELNRHEIEQWHKWLVERRRQEADPASAVTGHCDPPHGEHADHHVHDSGQLASRRAPRRRDRA